ncbi:hypothetical protein SETIT_3G002300v2 [Setaria italica]|uniref:Uncharacterized protein n=1 Tax=Setaria italica TaxID=4555 RepID=A0A368Q9S6_SETIT|nr:hypothetical protein SETIT_3G002300v2 [Setaria italica]
MDPYHTHSHSTRQWEPDQRGEGLPLVEVEGHGRLLAPEARVAQQVEPHHHGHHLEGRHVQHHRHHQRQDEEDGRRPRVAPAQQRLRALPLRGQVADHRLDAAGDAAQAVVAHPHHVPRLARGEGVELLVQLVGVHQPGLRVRQHRVHVRRLARPPPVVPHADHEQVQEHRREDQLRVAHQDEEQHVHQHRRQRVLPLADAVHPLAHRHRAGEERRDAVEVGLAPPQAEHVRVHVQHVLHHLAPQRGLRPPQPRRHLLHRLEPQVVQLQHGDGVGVVHLGQQRPPVHAQHVGPGRAGEAHRQVELPGLLQPRRRQRHQRVVVGVHAVDLQRRQPHAHLADPLVLLAAVAGAVHEGVVEGRHRQHGAGVEHLPGVLLVPLRRQRVERRPRAHPLSAVLGHAVGVLGGPRQVARAQDAQLQDADGPLPELLRRRLQVAGVVRRLVQHVVRRLQAQPQVDLARELTLLVVRVARRRLVRRQRPRQGEPLGVHRLGQVVAVDVRRRHGDHHPAHRLVPPRRHLLLHRHHQRLVERLPGHEHELLVPHRVGRPLRPRPPDLPAQLDLGDGGSKRPALLRGHQVLRRDDHHLEVLAGEGEGLAPHGVGVLLQVLGHALEVAQLHLHERVERAGDVHGRQVSRLDHRHVQVAHGLHHVVGGGDLGGGGGGGARAHLGRQRRLGLHEAVAGAGRGGGGWAGGARHGDHLAWRRGRCGDGVERAALLLLLLCCCRHGAEDARRSRLLVVVISVGLVLGLRCCCCRLIILWCEGGADHPLGVSAGRGCRDGVLLLLVGGSKSVIILLLKEVDP